MQEMYVSIFPEHTGLIDPLPVSLARAMESAGRRAVFVVQAAAALHRGYFVVCRTTDHHSALEKHLRALPGPVGEHRPFAWLPLHNTHAREAAARYGEWVRNSKGPRQLPHTFPDGMRGIYAQHTIVQIRNVLHTCKEIMIVPIGAADIWSSVDAPWQDFLRSIQVSPPHAVADRAGQGAHMEDNLRTGTTAGCSPCSSTAPHAAQPATAGASVPTDVL